MTIFDVPVVQPVLPPDPEIHQRGFILAEEDALKQKLSNISVTDLRNPGQRIPVRVWFRNPEGTTEKTYPFLTIDLVDIVFASDRAHDANFITVEEWPSTWPDYSTSPGVELGPGQVPQAMRYLPYDIFFQVASHARSAQHDRELQALLLTTNFLPYRYGWLEVAADETVRYLELVYWQQADVSEDPAATRRLFRKVYTVKVHAYLPVEWPLPFGTVEEVIGVIKARNGGGLVEDESWHHVAEPIGP